MRCRIITIYTLLALLGLGIIPVKNTATASERPLEGALSLDQSHVKEVTDVIGDNAEKELHHMEKKAKSIMEIIRDFIDRMLAAITDFFEKITS